MKPERIEDFRAQPATGRIDDIEILRAIAILFVMVQHLGFLLPWQPAGLYHVFKYATFWSGVDLFFAVSGFVIARDLLPRLSQADALPFWREAGAFWIRRAFRIFPSVWLWLVIGLLLSAVASNTFGPFRNSFNDAVAVVFQYFNLHYWQCYAAASGACSVTGIYWSLATEEQFYMLLPLSILLFRKKFIVVIALLALVQILTPRPAYTFLWFFRTDALLLGVLIAAWSGSQTCRLFEPTFLRARLARWATVSLLLVGLACVPEDPLFGKLPTSPIYLGILAIVCALLVFIASFDRNYIARPGAIKAIMVWIGQRSFALYLIHTAAYGVTREFWMWLRPGVPVDGRYLATFLLTAIPLMLVLAELNYRLLEDPLRKAGRRLAERFRSRGLVPRPAALA